MPSRPMRPCRVPGCPHYALPSGTLCAEHQGAYGHRPNMARHGMYCTRAWTDARRRYLMEHPLCVACEREGRLTPATEIDHIVPHKGDPDLFWDESNWQALCHSCHSTKTAQEDGGFGNAGRRRG